MEFHVNLSVEVEQKGNGLLVWTPVPVQVVFQRGRWRAEAETPGVRTDMFDTMEEALVAGAKEATAELQAAVLDRPVIAGKISPAQAARDFF
jgi:hypothetical protein